MPASIFLIPLQEPAGIKSGPERVRNRNPTNFPGKGINPGRIKVRETDIQTATPDKSGQFTSQRTYRKRGNLQQDCLPPTIRQQQNCRYRESGKKKKTSGSIRENSGNGIIYK
ncbi:hypothetical protein CDAR_520011 [Caerostris darwini]|uniref:Uncharacterized protein n=1 Tax=Caerostris darwini TaxID=1538125 RepID=A0AAV4WUP8_9ARAC|nr:hypothetical protein CDAR_520011 [Caerostris darwini]